MDREQMQAFVNTIPGAVLDYPFEELDVGPVLRRIDNKKWFGVALRHNGEDFLNLKCDPVESEFLRSVYSGIKPGYHMNKTHWISVYFDLDVPDELFEGLILKSFALVAPKGRRK
ncbi:MAG: MmcQ/YjbR family DNA-binding protein [Clostridia bacterium]|nr:MmcQ/YjbR family DNA-binding protein [Clostridia bacterium]